MKPHSTKAVMPHEVRRQIKQVLRLEADLTATVHAGTIEPARFTLVLGEEIDFEFGPRAYFRMGTVDDPFDITDCTNPKRAHAATVSWLWACLSRQDADEFPEPEDLAEVIPFDRLLECTKAFIKAITDYNATRKAATATDTAKPKAGPPDA